MLISAFGWYGGLIGGGMVICILLGYFMAKKRGYDTDNIFDIALVCIPLAILGARTYYVLNDMAHNGTKWTIGEYFGFSNGQFVGFAGLAIYGGLLGGILGAVIVRQFINKRKLPEKQMTLIQMADLCFCLIILGQAIGRWGNFANGEAYGQLITNPSLQWFPFAVYIEGGKMGTGWYHATFFYESLWNFIGFGLLQWLYNGKRKSFDGFYFAFYCIWYGFIRFWIEMLRSDSMYFGPIKANCLISALILILGIGIIVYHIIMARRAGKKPFIFVYENELNFDYYDYDKSFLYLKTTFGKKQSGASAKAKTAKAQETKEEIKEDSDGENGQ
ncbi:MAG: prolipoprotein diacylglyceryl transferase [Clostridiales bacterium]|nr:prolipoprotein diacylglyceryl transferase [Clostridiales bacterium]